MMNLGTVIKAFDAFMALRAVARRARDDVDVDDSGALATGTAPNTGGQVEARLTNVVVAALKEAFNRDHARLELERAQLDEQRRRAEEAMRLELRRQAIERELTRLRFLAVTALVGWVASVLLVAARVAEMSVLSRSMMGAGWLLLLGALAAALTAQGRIEPAGNGEPTPASAIAVWLLTGGLTVCAMSLLW